MKPLNMYKETMKNIEESINIMIIDIIKDDVYPFYHLSSTGLKYIQSHEMEYALPISVYHLIREYLTNPNKNISKSESAKIKKELIRAAYQVIYQNLGMFLTMDTEINFIFDILQNCRCNNADSKRMLSYVRNSIGREMHHFNMDYLTIRELCTIICNFTGKTILELNEYPMYHMYQLILTEVYPNLGFRGLKRNTSVVFTYFVCQILNMIYGYDINKIIEKEDVLENRSIYHIRKTVGLSEIRNHGFVDSMYDFQTFYDILIKLFK